jgi:hypothetical protein
MKVGGRQVEGLGVWCGGGAVGVYVEPWSVECNVVVCVFSIGVSWVDWVLTDDCSWGPVWISRWHCG